MEGRDVFVTKYNATQVFPVALNIWYVEVKINLEHRKYIRRLLSNCLPAKSFEFYEPSSMHQIRFLYHFHQDLCRQWSQLHDRHQNADHAVSLQTVVMFFAV